jgi:monoamine oxidase
LAAGAEILTDAPVKQVTYGRGASNNGDGATVQCEDGTLLHARCVVVTVPISVLRDGDIGFDPPLPEEKRNAISSMRMGQAVKLLVRFKAPFWPVGDVTLAVCPRFATGVLPSQVFARVRTCGGVSAS